MELGDSYITRGGGHNPNSPCNCSAPGGGGQPPSCNYLFCSLLNEYFSVTFTGTISNTTAPGAACAQTILDTTVALPVNFYTPLLPPLYHGTWVNNDRTSLPCSGQSNVDGYVVQIYCMGTNAVGDPVWFVSLEGDYENPGNFNLLAYGQGAYSPYLDIYTVQNSSPFTIPDLVCRVELL